MHEENYLLISDIHNYAVCPRRFALRALECRFADTWRTVDGTNMHSRAHNRELVEKRGSVITMRGLRVLSHQLKVVGECDVVEFRLNPDGVTLAGYEGKYSPFPIEYKRGRDISFSDCDRLQLCAQALCLEEMLLCDIACGALFYGEPHRRIDVEFTDELRKKVVDIAQEMHGVYSRKLNPKPVKCKFCAECSLNSECLPMLAKVKSVQDYINKHLNEE